MLSTGCTSASSSVLNMLGFELNIFLNWYCVTSNTPIQKSLESVAV